MRLLQHYSCSAPKLPEDFAPLNSNLKTQARANTRPSYSEPELGVACLTSHNE